MSARLALGSWQRACLAACLLAGFVPPAAAQIPAERPERPNLGIFGGGVGDAEQALILTGQSGGGFDHIWTRDPAMDDASPGRTDPGATFAHWGAGLGYRLARSRASVSLSGNSSGRYFPAFADSSVSTYGAIAAGDVGVTRRTSLFGDLRFTHRPVSALSLVSGFGADVLPADYAAGAVEYRTTAGAVGLRQQVTRRSNLAFGYGGTRIRTDDLDSRQTSQYGYVRFDTVVTRALGVHVGYGHTQYRYAGADLGAPGVEQRLRSHNIDVGIDYSRTLSFSRRTALSVNTGSIALTDGDEWLVSLIGGGTLVREMGRTWNATLGFNRAVGFLEVFDQPTLTDNATFTIGGLLGRRVRAGGTLAAARGTVGFFRTGGSDYLTYRGGAYGSTAITRTLAVRADYTYSQFRFNDLADVPEALGNRQVRYHSVRVGLDVWLPIWARARRP